MTSDELSWPRGESRRGKRGCADAFQARQRFQLAIVRLALPGAGLG